jgi:hypothetical protein
VLVVDVVVVVGVVMNGSCAAGGMWKEIVWQWWGADTTGSTMDVVVEVEVSSRNLHKMVESSCFAIVVVVVAILVVVVVVVVVVVAVSEAVEMVEMVTED